MIWIVIEVILGFLHFSINKGDPLGHFLFGGSDIVMIFSEDLHFELTAEKDKHILMGNEYGKIFLR